MSITPQDIIAVIRTRGRGDPPSALADIFVNPLVKVLLFVDGKIDLAKAQQTIDSIILTLEDEDTLTSLAAFLNDTIENISLQLRTALEDIGSNFGLTRRPAAASSGNVVLMRSTDLIVPPDSPITVPSGKKVFAPSLNQEYRITSTTIINSMTFDDVLQKFVFTVPVQSVNVGLATIAASNQVSQIRDPIPGIEEATNVDPLVGGRDEESDRNLGDRIKSALSANNIGTVAGYRDMVLGITNVQDTNIIGAGSPFMVRDEGDGGSLDVYVTDPIAISVSDLATASNYQPSGPKFVFTPSRQPLINDISTIQPTDVDSISKDVGIFAGSIKANDTIIFDSDHTGELITYQVNDLIREVDVFVQDETRKIVGSDILVKEAVPILVDVIITIQVLPEFSSARDTVRDNAEAAITQFITSLGIGDDLEQSDVISIITNVDGVDRVNLPPTKFEKSVNTGQINIIEASANEVLRPGTILVNF